MARELSIPTPADFVLPRDLCSYGYFLLEPNNWTPADQAFTTTLDVGAAAVTLRVRQPDRRAGSPLSVTPDRALSSAEKNHVAALLARMLRLDESAHTIRAFHALDPRFAPSGRGRLMRSPTMFEDVIKTVTSCNVTWPSTVSMNRRLCEHVGRRSASDRPAFPSADRLARIRPASLRARCGVGYRDARIVQLAKMFARGQVNESWFSDPATPDDAVFDALVEWPGIGPYAAANIMQLLGRFARLPLDTESVRHGRDLLGYKGTSAQIMKKVHAHYEPFGAHRFRSYWFELWDFYERKRGPAWTWERETTGKTFTAALLKAMKEEPPPGSSPASPPRPKARARKPHATTRKRRSSPGRARR